MPNIETHGFFFDQHHDVAELEAQIVEIFAGWPCARDMVIETFLTGVRDLFGESHSYLRVWDTDEEEGKRIATRLRLEGFDVELPVCLKKFLAKPLYSLEEIEAELRRINPSVNSCDGAIYSLRKGDTTSAQASFERAISVMHGQHSDLLVPSVDEMAEKWNVPQKSTWSEIAMIKGCWIRWHQMLAILKG